VSREAARQRLTGARGHLDGVVRMIDEDRYCIDVLHQITAVQGALDSARRALLDNHLRTCVRDGFLDGRMDEVVEELVDAVIGHRTPGAGPARHCHHGHASAATAASADR
jgi:CsoR family transcriptional regulator, copper-sensing transcriptional repressor